MKKYICMGEPEGSKSVIARELKHGCDFWIRTSESFAGKAIYLNDPPTGFEWVMGQDESSQVIVFQKRL